VTDIATRLIYTELTRDARKVLRTLTGIEHEVQVADGSATYIMRILPYRTAENVIAGVVLTFIDITERKRAEEDRARLAALVGNSYDAIVGIATDGTITSWNAGAERIYGYTAEEAIGRSVTILAPKRGAGALRQSLEKLRRGVAVRSEESEAVTKDGRTIWIAQTLSPIKDNEGKVVAAAAIQHDITERKHAESNQSLLVQELDHRVKNTMATVLSVATRTLRNAKSLDDFAKTFEGRMRAMTTAHELLAANTWKGSDLREIVQRQLAPFGRRRGSIGVAGDEIMLTARASIMMGIIVHELATKAAKHGALSVPSGRIEIKWRLAMRDGQLSLLFVWQESGGPKPKPKRRNGFGHTLIERGVRSELEGTSRLTFGRTGLRCELVIPLAEQDLAGSNGRGTGRKRSP
jgi:two-component system CheB/CheR fusion protein